MTHSPTPPATVKPPVEKIRQLLSLSDVKDRVGPELLAWLKSEDQLDAWQAEENKRVRFVEAVRECIYWNDRELDENAIRGLFELTVAAVKNGEL